MKVHIIIGHKKGNKEYEYNLVTALSMYEYLKGRKVNVTLDTENTEVDEEVYATKGLEKDDIIISIHYNGGGGDGFECFHYSTDAKMLELCKAIEKEVLAIKQNSRGIKNGNGYKIINSTKAHSIILEGAFMDNSKDWQGINLKEMGIAYGIGVCKYLGLNVSRETMENYLMLDGVKYRVEK